MGIQFSHTFRDKLGCIATITLRMLASKCSNIFSLSRSRRISREDILKESKSHKNVVASYQVNLVELIDQQPPKMNLIKNFNWEFFFDNEEAADGAVLPLAVNWRDIFHRR